jgi:23S rRNA (adenine(2503)-C(2))-methyltransferase
LILAKGHSNFYCWMDTQKLEQFLVESGQPKFRLGQIQKAIFADGVASFSEITTLSKDLREKIAKEMQLLSFAVEKVLTAKDEQSIKALLKLEDGNLIETVLISPKPGTWSACISCQVGCAMGCRFCATGKMGFKRNLTAEEITDQVLFWRQYLRKNKIAGSFSNIVYMGMGEPFLNWENVSESIKNLTDAKLFGFGSRSLSVSTSGITEGIGKLAAEFPQVNLAISLHFASDEKRDRFMPVNKKDNLASLKKALQNYFQITNRKVFLEYIMLDGINDTALDAKLLSDFVYSIGNTHLLHMNLIRYNTVASPPAGGLKPSSKTRTQLFKQELEKHRVSATIRKSLGEEIQGACGQLAGK